MGHMRKRIYIETTIASYLTARPSRDLVRAARQQMTSEWWDVRRAEFDLHVSQVVVDEAAGGDPEAAELRLHLLVGVPRVAITEEVEALAASLLHTHALPEKAAEDALHIALATVHGMDFLLTWNCAHIANAEMMPAIRSTILAAGYACPEICTPEEMLGAWEE